MKYILGGKGANLAEMSKIGIPVPAGFTISTEVCKDYNDNHQSISCQSRIRSRRVSKKTRIGHR